MLKKDLTGPSPVLDTTEENTPITLSVLDRTRVVVTHQHASRIDSATTPMIP